MSTKHRAVAYDKHGKPIEVDSFVLTPEGKKFKIHGFTVTTRPGTYAYYAHDLEVTNGEGWVDSSTLVDEETIIWGS